jgi:hypothetical protein
MADASRTSVLCTAGLQALDKLNYSLVDLLGSLLLGPMTATWKQKCSPAHQICSESQARNFSDSHDEHDVVGIKDHYLFGRLACPKEIPK